MNKLLKLAVGGVCAYAAVKAFDTRPEVSRYTVSSKKIPSEFDNFKIAHISDYHNASPDGVAELIAENKPDITVMTGDMTSDSAGEEYTPAIEFMSQLVKIAPCFAVSGNHDTWRADYKSYVKSCRKIGVCFLENEDYKLYKNSEYILLSGMSDVFTKVNTARKIKESLSHFSASDKYRIFLFHRANMLDIVKDFGFDLILSGHLHGGQMRLPYIGGICAPLSGMAGGEKIIFPKYSGGLYKFESSTAIVNRGIGNPIPLPRIFNRPEIGIITLKSIK